MNQSATTYNRIILDLIVISCLVGFIGDASLQFGARVFNMGGPTGWGLNPYFAQHGQVESTYVAGGMMALFYIVYFYILRLPINYGYLAIYGIIFDFIFRKFEIFPSLKGYYQYFSYFGSAFWGAIPAIVPLLIYDGLRIIIR